MAALPNEQLDPILDDLDKDSPPPLEVEQDSWRDHARAWILPVFGVVGGLVMPWVLIGLIFLLTKLFT